MAFEPPLPVTPAAVSDPPDEPGCGSEPATPEGPRPAELSGAWGRETSAVLPVPGRPGALAFADAPVSAPRWHAASPSDEAAARTSIQSRIRI